MILISSFAALLAASGTRSANAVQSADQDVWAQYSLACAEMGIDPGSAAFNQCVEDLHRSLWAEQNLYKS
jgi:hypothetical protein